MTKPRACCQTPAVRACRGAPRSPLMPQAVPRQVGQLGDLTMSPMASPEAFAEFARAHGWRVRIAPAGLRSAV
jgi:hypothetical protein